MSGDYIAGFVDGEGCFALKLRKDKQKNKATSKVREYFYWGVEFVIQLRSDDINILRLLKNTLGCGTINLTKDGEQVRFSVQNISENNKKIIPFFEKYKIYGKKGTDFKLWGKAVRILAKYKNGDLNIKKGQRGFVKKDISSTDLKTLSEIRNKMLVYKSYRDKMFKWGNPPD